MSSTPLGARSTNLCSGAAPTPLVLPNLGVANQNQAQAPAPTPAPQPLDNPSSLGSALPERFKPFDAASVGDTTKMTINEIIKLKTTGPRVNIYTRHLNDPDKPKSYKIARAGVPGALPCAFSNKAKQELQGLPFGKVGAIKLSGVSPTAIEAMVSYLFAACTPNTTPASATEGNLQSINKSSDKKTSTPTQATGKTVERSHADGKSSAQKPISKGHKMPTIYTRHKGWSEYLYIWKMAEDLDMPRVVAKLKSQTYEDFAGLSVAELLDGFEVAEQMKLKTPQVHLSGRLWAMAKGQTDDYALSIADLNAFLTSAQPAQLENINHVAIGTFAYHNYIEWTNLEGASAELKEKIFERWSRRQENEVRKAQAIADRKADRRWMRDNAMLTWDSTEGKVKAYYPTN